MNVIMLHSLKQIPKNIIQKQVKYFFNQSSFYIKNPLIFKAPLVWLDLFLSQIKQNKNYFFLSSFIL